MLVVVLFLFPLGLERDALHHRIEGVLQHVNNLKHVQLGKPLAKRRVQYQLQQEERIGVLQLIHPRRTHRFRAQHQLAQLYGAHG